MTGAALMDIYNVFSWKHRGPSGTRAHSSVHSGVNEVLDSLKCTGKASEGSAR